MASTNAAMLAVFRRSGCQVTSHHGDGVVELKLLFEPPAAGPAGVSSPRWAVDEEGQLARAAIVPYSGLDDRQVLAAGHEDDSTRWMTPTEPGRVPGPCPIVLGRG